LALHPSSHLLNSPPALQCVTVTAVEHNLTQRKERPTSVGDQDRDVRHAESVPQPRGGTERGTEGESEGHVLYGFCPYNSGHYGEGTGVHQDIENVSCGTEDQGLRRGTEVRGMRGLVMALGSPTARSVRQAE